MLGLPTEREVSENVSAWSNANQAFAAILAGGVPVHQALSRWGLLLLRQNRPTEAAASFCSALTLQPSDPVLWLNYGLSLDQSNAFTEAAACFEKSLVFSPGQSQAWLLLGLVRKKLGDLPGAEAAYRRALELEPNLPVAWQCLGLLKEEQRDFPAAIDHLTACIRHGGPSAPVLADLAKLYHLTGRFPEAVTAFQKALDMEPANQHYRQMLGKTRFLCDALQNLPIEESIASYRVSVLPAESVSEQELMDLFDKTIALLGGFGHLEPALRLGRKRLELWTASPTVEYFMRAMAGDTTLDRSPPQFIVEQFDASADSFDHHLVNDLGYDIPGKLVKAVRALTPSGHLYDALDAGCGTGLCGPFLRPLSRRLVAVDLSPKMLEHVAKRGLYDQLVCEELVQFLARSPGQFDLVVAADVFIYFGDIEPIFSAAASALRPGGLLAFSTQSGPPAGYRLLPSGHFAHAPDYVRAAAGGHYKQELCVETTIRLEATHRLPGNLFLFRRQGKI